MLTKSIIGDEGKAAERVVACSAVLMEKNHRKRISFLIWRCF